MDLNIYAGEIIGPEDDYDLAVQELNEAALDLELDTLTAYAAATSDININHNVSRGGCTI